MNVTTTGIAVAVAVVIVGIVFVFPNLSPFAHPGPAATSTEMAMMPDSAASTTSSTSSTMPNENTTTTPDGLQITDTVVGTGPALAAGDTVQIKYTGMLANGTVFDSSDAHGGTPLTLLVGQDGSLTLPSGGGLIPGWSEGVVGMKEGGTRTLVIPPALGYGAGGIPGVIPANATLTFTLQLLSVTK